MARLTLNRVTKSFGAVPVLHGIDLDIADGEFVVFVGPSGCGKSTLLRLIAGLEEANGGEIAIDGASVIEVPAAKRGLAMVFQSYALYPHMSVRKNLSFGLETMGAPKGVIAARVEEAARILQIGHLLDRRPGQLSGGQRQRVAIGRAIVREPKVFLFDEPLSNLDAELRVQMRVEINKLHRRLKTTMIFVTHDQVEAMTLADRIVVLRAGRIEQVGTPLELYNRPANLFVAGFIGSPRMNFIKAAIVGESAAGTEIRLSEGARLALPVTGGSPGGEGAVTLGIRPESVRLGADGAALTGEVQIAEQMGAATFVHLALPSEETITVEVPGQLSVRSGERLPLALDPGGCHLFDGEGVALRRLVS